MRRILLVFGLSYLISHLVPGPLGILIIAVVLVGFLFAERCARAVTDVKLLQHLSEQPRTLDELLYHLSVSPITICEAVTVLFSGRYLPTEIELYARLREWSGDPLRPFHPMLGRIRFPGDDALPLWVQIMPSWKAANEVEPEVLSRRRSWKQTNGEPGSDRETVREFLVEITAQGRSFLHSLGLPDETTVPEEEQKN
jgi:hypothetical protein